MALVPGWPSCAAAPRLRRSLLEVVSLRMQMGCLGDAGSGAAASTCIWMSLLLRPRPSVPRAAFLRPQMGRSGAPARPERPQCRSCAILDGYIMRAECIEHHRQTTQQTKDGEIERRERYHKDKERRRVAQGFRIIPSRSTRAREQGCTSPGCGEDVWGEVEPHDFKLDFKIQL